MEGMASFEPDMAQIKVTFTTTEDDFQLPESKRQLLVPAGTHDLMKDLVAKHTAKADFGM